MDFVNRCPDAPGFQFYILGFGRYLFRARRCLYWHPPPNGPIYLPLRANSPSKLHSLKTCTHKPGYWGPIPHKSCTRWKSRKKHNAPQLKNMHSQTWIYSFRPQQKCGVFEFSVDSTFSNFCNIWVLIFSAGWLFFIARPRLRIGREGGRSMESR